MSLPPIRRALFDLTQELGQVWIGFVRPLSLRYAIFDERRVVMVAALPVLPAKSEPETGE